MNKENKRSVESELKTPETKSLSKELDRNNPEELLSEESKDKSSLKVEVQCVKWCISSVEFVLDESLSETEIRKFLIDLKSN